MSRIPNRSLHSECVFLFRKGIIRYRFRNGFPFGMAPFLTGDSARAVLGGEVVYGLSNGDTLLPQAGVIARMCAFRPRR
jgi:hypothetical protein